MDSVGRDSHEPNLEAVAIALQPAQGNPGRTLPSRPVRRAASKAGVQPDIHHPGVADAERLASTGNPENDPRQLT